MDIKKLSILIILGITIKNCNIFHYSNFYCNSHKKKTTAIKKEMNLSKDTSQQHSFSPKVFKSIPNATKFIRNNLPRVNSISPYKLFLVRNIISKEIFSKKKSNHCLLKVIYKNGLLKHYILLKNPKQSDSLLLIPVNENKLKSTSTSINFPIKEVEPYLIKKYLTQNKSFTLIEKKVQKEEIFFETNLEDYYYFLQLNHSLEELFNN